MAVIGFSTSMLANTTDVTYTEPTYICDKYDSGDKKGQDKVFEDFTDSYVETITLTNGSQEKTWNHPGTRTFWNVLSDMTMDAKAGETISAHFVANSLGNYSESNVYQDLRFTAVVLAIDWDGDGTFEYAELIKGKTPPVHFQGGNAMNSQEQLDASQASSKPTTFDPDWYVMDYTYDIVVPKGVTPGTKARVRFNYTNAWFGDKTANDFVNTCKEGIVYDFDINIVGLKVTWEQPENGTITVKNEDQELNSPAYFDRETILTIIPTPDSDEYELASLTANGNDINPDRSGNYVTRITENTVIAATFDLAKYLINWPEENYITGGSLKVVYADNEENEITSDITEVPHGTELKIIPQAEKGYSLTALSYQPMGGETVNFNIGEEEYTFTVGGCSGLTKYIFISAEFTQETYTLSTSVTPENGGSVSVTDTEGTTVEGNLTYGQTIVITASANGGYTFESLDVKGATKVDSQENQYTVEGNVTVTATFVEDAPVETWSEVHFNTMSGSKSGEIDLSKDPYYVKNGTETENKWNVIEYGASNTDNKYGPYIKQPKAGYYLAYKYNVEKEATYRFSFLHKKGETTSASVKLQYTTDLANTYTDASEAVDVPKIAAADPGELIQSNRITIKPGTYYFVYYIESAATSDIKIRIADFKLEMLDGSAVEPTPEYAVTLNKPENGNLSVKYSNGEEEVTVSTEDATEPKTFNVAENTKLTVTVTPAEGYQLATLSPKMTEIAGNENVYEYTVTTEDVNIEATFEKVFEPYAQNFGQAVGNASNNRTWTNTVFDVESGEKTINVNYTTSQDSYDVYSDEFVNEENKVEIFADETFDLTVNGNLTWVYTLVYIDWNGDGVFDEEPANLENLGFNPVNESDFNTAGVSDTRKYSVKVPENAKIGETRARIVIGWKGARGFEMNSQEVIVGTTESGEQGQRKNAMARDFLLNIKERPQATMYNVTVNKPVNGNLSVTYNNGTDNVTVSTEDATEAQTFEVAEGTKLTVTVTPADDYQLETLSPDMTKVEDRENVYEYTVIKAVTIEATFVEEVTFDYVPVPIKSGFNTDVIAEAKPSADHTSGTLDSEGWVLFTSDIQEEGALPLDLTTVDNIPYKMADVTSNNAAVLKGENTESTLVFKNPAKAEEVRLLSISAEGESTMEVTVNYDDDTNQTQSFIIADWWNSKGGQGEAYYGLDRIITENEGRYSKDQIDGRKQFRLFEQVVTTDPEKTIVSVKVVNKSTGTKTPSVLGVTVLGELLEVEPIMHSITVNKPVNGNLAISYMANDEMQSIETYNFEEDSKVFSIEEGTVLSISVNPDFDYVLDQILPEGMEEKTGLAGDTYYEYTVTGDATIEATFKAIQYGKVSAETSEKGSIEIQQKNLMTGEWIPADEFVLEQVEFGTELRAKVEANTGYELVSVMKNQEELSTEEEGYYYFTVDAEAITISAEFEAQTFTLTKEVTPAEGGSVSVTVDGTTVEGTVKYGDIITVAVTVNKGYLLKSIVVEGADAVDGEADQYTVTGNVTITATFTEDTSSINSIENGTVYYNAEEEVLYTDAAKSVRVYDLSGRLVINAENQGNVSLAELAEGIYTAVVDGTIIKLNK